MKVLWIVNILFPFVSEKLHKPICNTGGWMLSSAQALLNLNKDVELAIATIYDGNTLIKYKDDNFVYYLLPLKGDNTKYHKELESLWRNVYDDFNPDITHLHGTEFAHGLAFINACPQSKVVVSIQGLVSIIARYYLSGISSKDIKFSYTIHDILKGSTLRHNKKQFQRRGLIEIEIIKKVKYVIGRTSWDRAQIWAINPNAKYYYCNETLRPSFYNFKWKYNTCKPYSIFISQAGYPIKGLHQVLKAMPLVLREYPNTKIYVAGGNIIANNTFKEKLRFGGYGKYIKRLIKRYQLEKYVVFLGSLTEEQMCQQYLKSNLFISPSSIENSPNSLGEAQLLGVPFIASYVGGTPDIMKDYENWLYRFDEIEMLADRICEIFKLKDEADFSLNQAKLRHDKLTNSSCLLNIYRDIITI